MVFYCFIRIHIGLFVFLIKNRLIMKKLLRADLGFSFQIGTLWNQYEN